MCKSKLQSEGKVSYSNLVMYTISWFFKRFSLFIFRKRGRKEKEREKNIKVWLPPAYPLLGVLAHNPGMCPDWELNPWSCGSQAGTQSTEPHQPGLISWFLKWGIWQKVILWIYFFQITVFSSHFLSSKQLHKALNFSQGWNVIKCILFSASVLAGHVTH